MAKFVAISGPSSSGKTSLINELSIMPELKDAIFLPDPFESVWNQLVSEGVFSEYEDISRDSDYLCIFILRVIKRYREFIDGYKASDRLIILDSCWIDISIYSLLNMWYSHTLKTLQEEILNDLSDYEDDISRFYFTTYEESKHKVDKFRAPFKRYNVKYNHPLELKYYKLFSHFGSASVLPTTDPTESAFHIIDDLKELGYL